ncbi:MAG: leucine-rich repeat protein [Oscillospiraceae bacterium]|nr:leucine-rich repeat protein [Oscillospiraceae bacterium]
MKKRFLATFLVLCLALGLLPGTVWAAGDSAPTSGSCGDGVTWTYVPELDEHGNDQGGTLTISGSGAMADFADLTEQPWYSWTRTCKNLVIEDGVTSIGKWAFQECDNLTNVTIPNSVTTIGHGSFCGCESLTSVTIPDSVTIIETVAFAYSGLTSVTIPANVIRADEVFSGCENLQTINVDPNNRQYSSQDGVLFNKEKSTLLLCPGGKVSYTIPNSVTEIGGYMFNGCSKLENISIPTSITSIKRNAFENCSNLKTVNYGGTETQWEQIEIEEGNLELSLATLICSGTDVPDTTYKILFNANGGVTDTASMTTGTDGRLTALPTPTRDGYTFDGWYTAADGGEKVTAETVFTADATVYAHWTENVTPPATYTITFNPNGGAGSMSPATVKEGDTFTLPACAFTAPAGKEFKAWQINGKEYAPGASYLFTSDTAVTAVWKDIPVVPVTHTVTFDPSGGTVTPATAATGKDGKLTALPTPVREGHTFDGWYTAADGGEKVTVETVFTADATVYAHWTGNVTPPVTYTITFNSNGGAGVMDAVTIPANTAYTLPNCAFTAPAGMDFQAWRINGVDYFPGESYTITANTVVTAIWRDKSSSDTNYIAILKTANGEIICNTRYAAQGERVTLSAHPAAGYELESVTVTDVRGRTVTVREVSDNRYTFTMPATRVEVAATFIKTEADATPKDDELFTGLGTPGISGIVLNPAPLPFTDVQPQHWFYDNVDYVWKRYLMSGVSDTRFAPQLTTSRAMIWTILARMNNVRTDVNPGATWYERGMLWAMEQGVTDGTNPMGDITREQLAAMLWRNAGRPAPGDAADLTQFSDSNAVSGYAQTAVRWAVSVGILNGSNGEIDPQGTATRAQVAAMAARYGDRFA